MLAYGSDIASSPYLRRWVGRIENPTSSMDLIFLTRGHKSRGGHRRAQDPRLGSTCSRLARVAADGRCR
jgi:hypothetical protein